MVRVDRRVSPRDFPVSVLKPRPGPQPASIRPLAVIHSAPIPSHSTKQRWTAVPRNSENPAVRHGQTDTTTLVISGASPGQEKGGPGGDHPPTRPCKENPVAMANQPSLRHSSRRG